VQAYQQYVGRSPSQQEVLSQLSGGRYYAPQNVSYAIRQIRNSQEARDYAAGTGADADAGAGAGTSDPNWFWHVGPGGIPDVQKLWQAVQYINPAGGLTAAALAELEKVFPGITVVNAGSGVVNIPGIGQVDLIRNMGSTDPRNPAQWWWGQEGGGGSGAGAGTGGAAGGAGAGGTGTPQVGGVPLDINSILGGDIWSDPSLSLLEQLSRYRLDELFQGVDDPYRDQFFGMLDERINQLQQYPWTESQESTLRTSATDRLQRDRQAAHEEMDRQLAALGHGKTSGTIVQAHLEVDRQFDELVNAQQQGFDVYAIETVNQRRDQALGLGGSAAQLSQSVRDEEQARRREALTIAALFPELQNQQMNQALAVMQGSPYTGQSIFQQMMQLATLGNQQQQYAQNQNNAFWQGLGAILYGWGNSQNQGA